jgi:hypothetical protein
VCSKVTCEAWARSGMLTFAFCLFLPLHFVRELGLVVSQNTRCFSVFEVTYLQAHTY